MRHVGLELTKDFVAKVAPHFRNEKLEEAYVYISATQGLHFLTFSLNVKESCFLPDMGIEQSFATFEKRYGEMGRRLSNAPVACNWQDFGYFRLSAENPLVVQCLLSLAAEWCANLPLVRRLEAPRQLDDKGHSQVCERRSHHRIAAIVCQEVQRRRSQPPHALGDRDLRGRRQPPQVVGRRRGWEKGGEVLQCRQAGVHGEGCRCGEGALEVGAGCPSGAHSAERHR